MSRLQCEFGGDKPQAERMACVVYEQLLRCPAKVQFRGVLCLAEAPTPAQRSVCEARTRALGGGGGG